MRFLLLILLTTSLCACHANLGPPAHRLAGTWTSTYDGTVLDIFPEDKTSGVFVVRPSMRDAGPFMGNFTATETALTLTEDDGGPCPDTPGHYEYALGNAVMQLSHKDDDCTDRADIMNYAWTRTFRVPCWDDILKSLALE